jgi:glycosyltransferase involved in cell wall biosynthesis
MTDVVIPVLNEAKTIRKLIETFKANPYVSRVIVGIDIESNDGTNTEASISSADEVFTSPHHGKGDVVWDALKYVKTPRVIFADGDYSGLTQEHINWMTLVDLDDSEMRVGIPDAVGDIPENFYTIPFYMNYPYVSGFRAVNTIMLRSMQQPLRGYLMETQINQVMRNVPILYKYMWGLSAPLRFTDQRMADMTRDRKLGIKLGIL